MNINRKILHALIEGKNPYDFIISESKLIDETYKCLLESVVNWMYVQIQLVKDLLNMPEIETWGHGFDTEMGDWSSYDYKRKQLMLMTYLDKSGVFSELRNYINSSDKVERIGSNSYNIKEIQHEFKSPEFLEEFRKTDVYKDMIYICLSGLKLAIRQS